MIPIARPRIVVDGGEIFYIFRDEERGSRVSLAHAAAVGVGKWTFTDLTNFPVDAWEPSYDTELWKQNVVFISLCSTPNKVMENVG